MEFALAILMLLFSFFFSGMEIAFLTASRLRIELKMRQGNPAAKVLSSFTRRTSEVLVTILIGNNLALVIFTQEMDGFLAVENSQTWIGLILAYPLTKAVLTTIIILIMAEYIPKAIFRSNKEVLVYPGAYLLNFFYYLFFVPVWLVSTVSKFLLKWFFRVPPVEREELLDFRDLKHYLEEVVAESEEQPVPDLDTEMLTNALTFKEVRARECMIPRMEIEAAPMDITIPELLAQFVETNLSKIVIYDESMDNIKGVVHSISMFQKPRNIPSIIRPALVVPETMLASDVLKELTGNKLSVAIVVDEFGGTSGMITTEDLVEEVFGEIEDEHDQEKDEVVEPDMVKVEHEDGTYTLGARLEIDDLNEEFKLALTEDDYYTTLGGLILYVAEDIPEEGQSITLKNYEVMVLEAMQNRIIKVKLSPKTEVEEGE